MLAWGKQMCVYFLSQTGWNECDWPLPIWRRKQRCACQRALYCAVSPPFSQTYVWVWAFVLYFYIHRDQFETGDAAPSSRIQDKLSMNVHTSIQINKYYCACSPVTNWLCLCFQLWRSLFWFPSTPNQRMLNMSCVLFTMWSKMQEGDGALM